MSTVFAEGLWVRLDYLGGNWRVGERTLRSWGEIWGFEFGKGSSSKDEFRIR